MAHVEESTPKAPEADALDGKPSSRPLLSSCAQNDSSPSPTAPLKREELHSPEKKASDGFQTKLLAFADAWEDLP